MIHFCSLLSFKLILKDNIIIKLKSLEKIRSLLIKIKNTKP
jgi:hypothetical protein